MSPVDSVHIPSRDAISQDGTDSLALPHSSDTLKDDRYNREIIKINSKRNLTLWLLQCCEQMPPIFPELRLQDEPSALSQLQGIFERLEVTDQQKLKAALMQAVTEWTLNAHGTQVLNGLALIAARIRASQVIRYFCKFLKQPSLLENLETSIALIGVLRGFAPSEEVESCFRRLLFSGTCEPKFAGQLFLGLCECNPDQYPEYVPYFIDLLEKLPENYLNLRFTMASFQRTVTLKAIGDRLHLIDRDYRSRFLQLLVGFEWSPAEIELIDASENPLQERRFLQALKDRLPAVSTPTPSSVHCSVSESLKIPNYLQREKPKVADLKKEIESSHQPQSLHHRTVA